MKKCNLTVYTLEHRDDLSGILDSREGWVLLAELGSLVETYTGIRKASAIRLAMGRMKSFWHLAGQASELRIRNKNGTYAPARTYPRSADPKRSKG